MRGQLSVCICADSSYKEPLSTGTPYLYVASANMRGHRDEGGERGEDDVNINTVGGLLEELKLRSSLQFPNMITINDVNRPVYTAQELIVDQYVSVTL